jgi:hypothetical protein
MNVSFDDKQLCSIPYEKYQDFGCAAEIQRFLSPSNYLYTQLHILNLFVQYMMTINQGIIFMSILIIIIIIIIDRCKKLRESNVVWIGDLNKGNCR